ncbi:EutN/CcmL family microcompartment protein [bacterium]|nr:EutN/CcmL family microcompartment protein [bacterium]
MFLAKITKTVTATEKHDAYQNRHVFIVQPVLPDGTEKGDEWVAVDCVGAGIGDTVVCGGAPGVARDLFQLDLAPIRTLIVAIVDHLDYRDIKC